jgi:guanylate kinase
MRKGILIVISGFSGAGKGTLVKELLKKYDNYCLSVSATTRAPRQGEKEGREYFFLSREEFENKIEKDDFIEYASYLGNYYGTPKEYVLRHLNKGENVILEIEIQGAAKIKEKFKDALMVFVAPPSAEILESRLVGRDTESREQINNRLLRAADESSFVKDYDYIIVNDVLNEAVKKLNCLIECRGMEVSENLGFIERLRYELKHFRQEAY